MSTKHKFLVVAPLALALAFIYLAAAVHSSFGWLALSCAAVFVARALHCAGRDLSDCPAGDGEWL